jgi:hypothetical protein
MVACVGYNSVHLQGPILLFEKHSNLRRVSPWSYFFGKMIGA